MRRYSGALIFGVVAVVSLAFLGSASSQEEPKRLVWAQSLPTGCLDPALNFRLPEWNINFNVFSGLVAHRPGSLVEVDPDLAESWEVSDDGLVYTFQLREGVEWHDGYGTVTADDVIYSWQRLMDPETGAVNSSDVAMVASMEAVEPLVLTVTLNEPFPAFLTTIANSAYALIVNQRAIEERGEEHCLRPVGSGPYRVASAEARGTVVIEAVDGHWRGRPAIDEVEMQVIPDEGVAVLALIAGDIDLMIVREFHNIARLRDAEGIQVVADPNASVSPYIVWINNTRAPLDDVRVRQALMHALDRETLVAQLSEGLITTVAHSVVPPALFGHTEEVQRYDYDPERARELLAEAGYPDGFATSMVVLNTAFHPAAATYLQAMWREIGVELEIVPLDSAALRPLQTTGDYDMTLSNPSSSEVGQFLVRFHSEFIPGQNMNLWGNPEVDELIEAQAAELDPQRRLETVHRIQELVMEELPGLPLMYTPNVIAAREGVTGIIPQLGWWRTYFYLMDIER